MENERIQTGIEVEDVEKAQQQLLAAIADAKGRVTKSEMKQLGAGQFNATINFDTAPEQAGPMRDRLRQLGVVSRFEVDRTQQSEGGAPQKDTKITRGDTHFFVQLYNIVRMGARENAVVQIAAVDVPTAYRTMQTAIAEIKGRVLKADLNESDRMNITGQFDFEVRRTDEPKILQAFASAGDILARNVNRAEENETLTDTKVRYSLTLRSAAGLRPRELSVLNLEVRDVEAAVAVFKAQVSEVGGRFYGGSVSHQRNGTVTARMTCEVPLLQSAAVVEKLKNAGIVHTQETTPDPQAHDGKLAVARIDVSLTSGESIIDRDDGVMVQVRRGLSWSAKYLLLSLSWLVVGLLFVLPWCAAIYGIYWVTRRTLVSPKTSVIPPAASPTP